MRLVRDGTRHPKETKGKTHVQGSILRYANEIVVHMCPVNVKWLFAMHENK